MKGAIRIGSGHNFGIPLGMNKIMGTATVQRRGIQSSSLPYNCVAANLCVSATQHIPHFFLKVQTNIEFIFCYDIIELLNKLINRGLLYYFYIV